MIFEQRSSAVGDLSDANADTALRKTAEDPKQGIPVDGATPSPAVRSPPTVPLVASELLCATEAVTSESALSLTTERASSAATAATAGSIGTHGSVPIAVARVSAQQQHRSIVCPIIADSPCAAGNKEGERGRLSLLSVESMPTADVSDILATHHNLLGLEKGTRTAAAAAFVGPRRSFRPISPSGAGAGTSSASTTTGSGVLADGSDRQQSFASSSFGLQPQQRGGSVHSVPSAFAALSAGGTAGTGAVPPPLVLAGSGHSHHHSGLPRMAGNPFSLEPSSSGTAATLVTSDGAATMVSVSASSQVADRPHPAESPEVPAGGGVSASASKVRCAEEGLDASDSTTRRRHTNATDDRFGAFFTSFNPPSTLDSRMGVPHAPRWAGSGASVISSAAATGAAAAGKESPVHHPYGFAHMPHVLGRSPIGSSSHNLAAVGGHFGHGLGPSPRQRRSGGVTASAAAGGGGADLRLLDGFRYGEDEAEGYASSSNAPQFLGRSDSGAAHGIGATTGTLLGMSEPKVVEADFRYSPESGGFVGGIVGISGSPSTVPPGGISAGSLHHVAGVGGLGLAPSGGLHPNVSATSLSASASASAAAAAQEHFQFGFGLSQGFGAMLCSNTEGAEVSATCTEEEGGLLTGRLRRQPHGSASVVSATTSTANEQSTISQASTSPSRHERPAAASAPTTAAATDSALLWPEEGTLRRQFTQQPSESEAARQQQQLDQRSAPEASRKGPSMVAATAIPSLATGHGLVNGYGNAKAFAGRHRSADEKRFTAVFGTRSGTAAASLSPATAMHSGAAYGTPTALSGRARASGGSLTLLGASGVGLTPSQQSVLAFHAQQTMLSQGSHSLQAAGDANSNSAMIGVGTAGHSPHTPAAPTLSGGVQQQLLTRLANADSGFGAGVAGGGRFSPASASTNNGLLGNDKASVATAAPNSALFSPNHPRTTPPHRHSTAASSSEGSSAVLPNGNGSFIPIGASYSAGGIGAVAWGAATASLAGRAGVSGPVAAAAAGGRSSSSNNSVAALAGVGGGSSVPFSLHGSVPPHPSQRVGAGAPTLPVPPPPPNLYHSGTNSSGQQQNNQQQLLSSTSTAMFVQRQPSSGTAGGSGGSAPQHVSSATRRLLGTPTEGGPNTPRRGGGSLSQQHHYPLSIGHGNSGEVRDMMTISTNLAKHGLRFASPARRTGGGSSGGGGGFPNERESSQSPMSFSASAGNVLARRRQHSAADDDATMGVEGSLFARLTAATSNGLGNPHSGSVDAAAFSRRKNSIESAGHSSLLPSSPSIGCDDPRSILFAGGDRAAFSSSANRFSIGGSSAAATPHAGPPALAMPGGIVGVGNSQIVHPALAAASASVRGVSPTTNNLSPNSRSNHQQQQRAHGSAAVDSVTPPAAAVSVGGRDSHRPERERTDWGQGFTRVRQYHSCDGPSSPSREGRESAAAKGRSPARQRSRTPSPTRLRASASTTEIAHQQRLRPSAARKQQFMPVCHAMSDGGAPLPSATARAARRLSLNDGGPPQMARLDIARGMAFAPAPQQGSCNASPNAQRPKAASGRSGGWTSVLTPQKPSVAADGEDALGGSLGPAEQQPSAETPQPDGTSQQQRAAKSSTRNAGTGFVSVLGEGRRLPGSERGAATGGYHHGSLWGIDSHPSSPSALALLGASTSFAEVTSTSTSPSATTAATASLMSRGRGQKGQQIAQRDASLCSSAAVMPLTLTVGTLPLGLPSSSLTGSTSAPFGAAVGSTSAEARTACSSATTGATGLGIDGLSFHHPNWAGRRATAAPPVLATPPAADAVPLEAALGMPSWRQAAETMRPPPSPPVDDPHAPLTEAEGDDGGVISKKGDDNAPLSIPAVLRMPTDGLPPIVPQPHSSAVCPLSSDAAAGTTSPDSPSPRARGRLADIYSLRGASSSRSEAYNGPSAATPREGSAAAQSDRHNGSASFAASNPIVPVFGVGGGPHQLVAGSTGIPNPPATARDSSLSPARAALGLHPLALQQPRGDDSEGAIVGIGNATSYGDSGTLGSVSGLNAVGLGLASSSSASSPVGIAALRALRSDRDRSVASPTAPSPTNATSFGRRGGDGSVSRGPSNNSGVGGRHAAPVLGVAGSPIAVACAFEDEDAQTLMALSPALSATVAAWGDDSRPSSSHVPPLQGVAPSSSSAAKYAYATVIAPCKESADEVPPSYAARFRQRNSSSDGSDSPAGAVEAEEAAGAAACGLVSIAAARRHPSLEATACRSTASLLLLGAEAGGVGGGGGPNTPTGPLRPRQPSTASTAFTPTSGCSANPPNVGAVVRGRRASSLDGSAQTASASAHPSVPPTRQLPHYGAPTPAGVHPMAAGIGFLAAAAQCGGSGSTGGDRAASPHDATTPSGASVSVGSVATWGLGSTTSAAAARAAPLPMQPAIHPCMPTPEGVVLMLEADTGDAPSALRSLPSVASIAAERQHRGPGLPLHPHSPGSAVPSRRSFSVSASRGPPPAGGGANGSSAESPPKSLRLFSTNATSIIGESSTANANREGDTHSISGLQSASAFLNDSMPRTAATAAGPPSSAAAAYCSATTAHRSGVNANTSVPLHAALFNVPNSGGDGVDGALQRPLPDGGIKGMAIIGDGGSPAPLSAMDLGAYTPLPLTFSDEFSPSQTSAAAVAAVRRRMAAGFPHSSPSQLSALSPQSRAPVRRAAGAEGVPAASSSGEGGGGGCSGVDASGRGLSPSPHSLNGMLVAASPTAEGGGGQLLGATVSSYNPFAGRSYAAESSRGHATPAVLTDALAHPFLGLMGASAGAAPPSPLNPNTGSASALGSGVAGIARSGVIASAGGDTSGVLGYTSGALMASGVGVGGVLLDVRPEGSPTADAFAHGGGHSFSAAAAGAGAALPQTPTFLPSAATPMRPPPHVHVGGGAGSRPRSRDHSPIAASMGGAVNPAQRHPSEMRGPSTLRSPMAAAVALGGNTLVAAGSNSNGGSTSYYYGEAGGGGGLQQQQQQRAAGGEPNNNASASGSVSVGGGLPYLVPAAPPQLQRPEGASPRHSHRGGGGPPSLPASPLSGTTRSAAGHAPVAAFADDTPPLLWGPSSALGDGATSVTSAAEVGRAAAAMAASNIAASSAPPTVFSPYPSPSSPSSPAGPIVYAGRPLFPASMVTPSGQQQQQQQHSGGGGGGGGGAAVHPLAHFVVPAVVIEDSDGLYGSLASPESTPMSRRLSPRSLNATSGAIRGAARSVTDSSAGGRWHGGPLVSVRAIDSASSPQSLSAGLGANGGGAAAAGGGGGPFSPTNANASLHMGVSNSRHLPCAPLPSAGDPLFAPIEDVATARRREEGRREMRRSSSVGEASDATSGECMVVDDASEIVFS